MFPALLPHRGAGSSLLSRRGVSCKGTGGGNRNETTRRAQSPQATPSPIPPLCTEDGNFQRSRACQLSRGETQVSIKGRWTGHQGQCGAHGRRLWALKRAPCSRGSRETCRLLPGRQLRKGGCAGPRPSAQQACGEGGAFPPGFSSRAQPSVPGTSAPRQARVASRSSGAGQGHHGWRGLRRGPATGRSSADTEAPSRTDS